jgi:hypothetical protein
METIRKGLRPPVTWTQGCAPRLRAGLACLLGLCCLELSLWAAVERSAYYELRMYDASANKLEGVLERFRNTVEPVRRKHGINTLGYWTASTTNGDKFVYLIQTASKEELQQREKAFGADARFQQGYAASNQKHGKTVDKISTMPLTPATESNYDFAQHGTPRAFEFRIYSVLPGKLDAFKARWRDFAVPIYQRHGLHSIGWWTAKDAAGNDQFVCLLAGDSFAEIQRSIIAFHQDSEWQRVEKETESGGKLRSSVEALKMTPTDFSCLR